VKLWTVQEKQLLQGNADPIISTRLNDEPYWRLSYSFMSSFYEKEKGNRLVSQLIWTWYDNTYFSNQDDQLDMVSTVESSAEHLQTKCVLNLSVPDKVPLLSSYSKWNRLMEYCVAFNQTPSCHQDWVGIFDLNGIQNHDYIQAVLPMIKRSWIISVVEINLDRFLSR